MTLAATALMLLAGSAWAVRPEAAIKAYEAGNHASAAALLQPLAEAGDADAQNFLGALYHLGQGVPRDEKTAVEWVRKAAEQGHVIAQYNLGQSYEDGMGVEADDLEAFRWYCRSAMQDYNRAKSKTLEAFQGCRMMGTCGVFLKEPCAEEFYNRYLRREMTVPNP